MEDPSNGPAAKLATLPTLCSFLVRMIKLAKFISIFIKYELLCRHIGHIRSQSSHMATVVIHHHNGHSCHTWSQSSGHKLSQWSQCSHMVTVITHGHSDHTCSQWSHLNTSWLPMLIFWWLTEGGEGEGEGGKRRLIDLLASPQVITISCRGEYRYSTSLFFPSFARFWRRQFINFHRPDGRYYSYLLPRQALAIWSKTCDKTCRTTGKIGLYISLSMWPRSKGWHTWEQIWVSLWPHHLYILKAIWEFKLSVSAGIHCKRPSL